jgi:selenocysteine lyase/cysteine desulfurase
MMLELGMDHIERRVLKLACGLRERLRSVGARLLYDESPHYESPIVAARFEGRDASGLAKRLKEGRIAVSARHGNLRVSVHFYNNEQDLDRFAAGVGALL